MKPNKCPLCGGEDGCKPSGGLMSDAPLSKDDWRKIYEFIKYIELPFLHNIYIQAIQRKKEIAKCRTNTTRE